MNDQQKSTFPSSQSTASHGGVLGTRDALGEHVRMERDHYAARPGIAPAEISALHTIGCRLSSANERLRGLIRRGDGVLNRATGSTALPPEPPGAQNMSTQAQQPALQAIGSELQDFEGWLANLEAVIEAQERIA